MRRELSFVLALVVVVGLSACALFTAQETPTLTVRDPVLMVGNWEVVISVSNLSEGLAGIQITHGGITTEGVDKTTVVASGMSGFIVTAQDFVAPEPEGTLMAVNPEQSITSGKILKLTFKASGSGPVVTLDKSKVTLMTDQGTLVGSWALATASDDAP
ncbi:hypothetical protein ACFLTM_00420 [Candidatus Bipolaricaulota bacterium]